MNSRFKFRFASIFSSVFFAAIVSSLLTSFANADERPNFLIFIADDMAWNDAGCYGHPHIQTPTIDRLANEGMRFDNAYLTISSCSPSRSSILTGRYPHNTGAGELHLPLPKDQLLFSKVLMDAGYYTAAAGKWHLGNNVKNQFDKIVGGKGPSGCERWEEIAKNRPKDKPFFFWFAAVDPHRGYKKGIIEKPHTIKDAIVPPFLPDTEKTREDLAMYYDEITRMDGYMAKVLRELKSQGALDDTLVLFISDNGRPFPRCKTTVYDSGVKTPFIVRWPKSVKAKSINKNLVSVIDIAPTFLQLAGAKVGKSFQGRSFAKMLADPTVKIREHVFAEHNWHDYQAHERSVRTKDFLYIKNSFPKLPGTPPADAVRSPTFDEIKRLRDLKKLSPKQMGCFTTPRPAEELYDVNKDPYQLENLAKVEKYKPVLEKMRTAHLKWVKRTSDQVPKSPTPDGFDREQGIRLINAAHPSFLKSKDKK